jgi:hypothetical protein
MILVRIWGVKQLTGQIRAEKIEKTGNTNQSKKEALLFIFNNKMLIILQKVKKYLSSRPIFKEKWA